MNTKNLIKMVRFGTPPELAVHNAKKYIDQGADVNGTVCHFGINEYMSPLIHVAIYEGHIHMVKVLLDHGASIQYNASSDKSPIDFAIERWVSYYIIKKNRTHLITNPLRQNGNMPHSIYKDMSKYRKYWPSDEEVRAYKIILYLMRHKCVSHYIYQFYPKGGEKNANSYNIQQSQKYQAMYNLFLERQAAQKKVDIFFALLINTKTDSNLGVQLIQLLSIEGSNYLTFNDIYF